ncbi:MAG: DUF262 domain-containing protein [Patescibacteria group bacterium]|nr:DUF262 domain-containing protein [Patescibacteria group bacterium]
MKIERINKIANYMKDIEGKIVVNKLLERLNSISFWELLSECTKIEIPIIQRDYAQGRDNEKTNKIRNVFLDSLIKAIESENESLELDFVYGDINNGIFQPLDGQQRLTTLYLLYWYFAYKTGNLSGNKNNFKKFTYETRISSREFCNELIEKGEKLGDGETLIEKITDASWFFMSWKKDPTIKAMLVMLNSIEFKLNGKSQEELTKEWHKLISENPPITFHFKQLNDIGLTDDLYIKMNARGKALTDFENFKARFEKHIKENDFEKDLSLTEANKEQWKELTEKTFSHRIDTVWTDLFWKHRGDDNLVDNEFVKFIAGIAINSYAENQEIFKSKDEDKLTRKILEEKKEKNITDEAVKRERIERRITLLFNNPNEITPEDFPSKTSFEYLKSCFDIYSHKELKYDELKPEDLKLWDFLEIKKVKINSEQELDNNLFLDLVKDGKTEYKQRVLFYAQTQFLLKVKTFNSKSFAEWMRVVRNIVQNATIDSAGAYIGAIGLINELSSGCTDVYNFLNKNSIKSGFASNQVSEEILKSSIITTDEKNKEVIFLTEDTNFFKGRILFGLFCIDFENSNDSFKYDSCNSLYKVVCEHLNSNDISNKFRSALLTVRNNDFYNYWGTWSYGTDSHKRCFIENIADLKGNFTTGFYKDYLKDLLLKLFEKSLDEIISEFSCPQDMPNWKCEIIKQPQLLDKYCQSHYFGISNDNKSCFLYYNKKRPSSRKECKKIE